VRPVGNEDVEGSGKFAEQGYEPPGDRPAPAVAAQEDVELLYGPGRQQAEVVEEHSDGVFTHLSSDVEAKAGEVANHAGAAQLLQPLDELEAGLEGRKLFLVSRGCLFFLAHREFSGYRVAAVPYFTLSITVLVVSLPRMSITLTTTRYSPGSA